MRYLRFLLIVPLLLSQAACEVPQSQIPLSDPADATIDHYLIGDWAEIEDVVDGKLIVAYRAYSVSQDTDGQLSIKAFGEDGELEGLLAGHATHIGQRKFLSLRAVDCPECKDSEADDASEPDHEDCPYMILQYATFVSPLVAEQWANEDYPKRELLELSSRYRGSLFVHAFMNDGFLEEITGSDGSGDVSKCSSLAYSELCIEADQADLQSFVLEYDEQLFADRWSLFFRLPPPTDSN